MATTTTSILNTPQAGDDSYSYMESEILASNSILVLDVMSNDSGGKSKTLYAIEASEEVIAALATQDATGEANAQYFNGVKVWIDGGKIMVDVSGSEALAALGAQSIEDLDAGQQLDLSFAYTIRLGNGTLSVATVQLTIMGEGSTDQEATATVAIEGSMRIGETLFAVVSNLDDPDGLVTAFGSWEVLKNGSWTVLPGSQDRTLFLDPLLTDLTEGAVIRFHFETLDQNGGTSTFDSSPVTLLAYPGDTEAEATGGVTLTPYPDDPSLLFADPGVISDVNGGVQGITFQWQKSATPDDPNSWQSVDGVSPQLMDIDDPTIGGFFVRMSIQTVDLLGETTDFVSAAQFIQRIIQGSGLINGTDNSDQIIGSATDDVIVGLGGNDTIDGGAGIDEIRGGDGDDVIYPGSGDFNASFGGSGNDTLHATEGLGHSYLFGDDGNDILFGGADYNYLNGGAGDDVLYGGTGNNQKDGGAGNDSLFGGTGGGTMFGSEGNDQLTAANVGTAMHGGAGSDTLQGGDGNDTLYADGNAISNGDVEWLHGGAGDDMLTQSNGTGTLNGGAGSDFIQTIFGNMTFVFNTPLEEEGEDGDILSIIFPETWTIQLDASIYHLPVGQLTELASMDSTGEEGVARLLLAGNTIYYDDNGGSTEGAQKIAVIYDAPWIDASHFVVTGGWL